MSTKDDKSRKKNGEGSIYQLANGKWTGKLQIGKKPDGKPLRKTFSGKTEAEVRKKIREFNKNKEKYLAENVPTLSFEEYINKWLYTYKRNALKPSSFDRLESSVKNYVIPNLGYLQLGNIENHDIQKVINDMFDKGLSHSSIKKVYDICNGVFNYAMIKDITQNPMLGVEMPSIKKFDKTEIKYFNDDETKRFEIEAKRLYKTGRRVYNYGYAFILMLNTGVRMGEVLGIDKYKDIDLDNNTLRIKRNVVVVKERDKNDPSEIIGYKAQIQDSAKTDAGDRIIPLNKKARESIEYLMNNCDNNSSLLISNPEGDTLSMSSFSKTFNKILSATDIEPCGLHTLRHTFASRLFKNGVDVKIVSELLGHSNVTITYNTYIHLIKEQKVKAIQSLDFDEDDDNSMEEN